MKRSTLMLYFAMVSGVSAQDCDFDRWCACSPRVYSWALNFSKTCDPIGVDFDNGGIQDATCVVRGGPNNNVTDLTPVAVEAIQFIEIGQEGKPIAVAEIPEAFQDGDIVNYTSAASFEEGSVVVPRALQANVLARNAAGEEIALMWSVSFTNNCGIYPILKENDNIGWTVFADLGAPENAGCCAVGTSLSTQEEEEEEAGGGTSEISNSSDCRLEEPVLTQRCNETVDDQLCADNNPANIALLGTETWTMLVNSPALENGLSCEEVAMKRLQQPVAEMKRQDPLMNELGPSEVSCNADGVSCTEVRPCELRCKDLHTGGNEVPIAGAVQEETEAPTTANVSMNTTTDATFESSSGLAAKGPGTIGMALTALLVGHAIFH